MRIGFACKYLHPDRSLKKKLLEEKERPLNCRATTVAWLNRQSRDVAEQRLWDIMTHNISAAKRLVEYVGALPDELRMVRLGSDILPVYTEPSWSYYWKNPDVQGYCERAFGELGDLARRLDVRVGWHPGQFCVLASDNPDIVDRSLEELEYHATMAQWMGYGRKDFDVSINVHLSGRAGAEGFLKSLPKMSTVLRRTLTLENDEYQAGLDDLLPLAKHVGIMLDIHHHLIHDGEFIQINDQRIDCVIESWRGVRPQIHYSQPREEYMQHFDQDYIPSWDELTSVAKKGKLRAHSDIYYNHAMNDWALEYLDWADIECECKSKNIGSQQLYEYWLKSKS